MGSSFSPVESFNVSFLIELSGPLYCRTETIYANSPPLIVGRDPDVAIHIPDPDRSLSRKHLSLDCTESGVRVIVLSTVNGISTTHGEIQTGQQVVLRPGESARMGLFTLRITGVVGAGSVSPVVDKRPHPDPFADFSNVEVSAPSVFDNAFFRPIPPQEPSLGLQHDVFASLSPPAAPHSFSAGPRLSATGIAMSASPSSDGVIASDPLAAFARSHASLGLPHKSIDDFLGGGSSGGLGASSMLSPIENPDTRRLAVDHVHDFNLPVRATLSQERPLPAPASLRTSGMPREALICADRAGSTAAAPPDAPPDVSPFDPAVKSWSEFSSDWLIPQPPQHTSTAQVVTSMSDPFSDNLHAEALDPFSDEWSSISSWQPTSAETTASTDATPSSSAATTPLAGVVDGATDRRALAALCKGLGVEGPSQLDVLKWEQMGEAISTIVQGLTELMNTRAEIKRELRAADRTMLGSQDNNPLKSGMAQEEILQYLLFNPTGVGGYMKVNKALDEAINDLRAHEFASIAAVRAAVEGTVRDFEPEKMRATLTKGKSKLPQFLDNARLWEMYSAHYETKATHMADWLEQLFNRYFMPVYSRESERLRSKPKQRTRAEP